MFYGLLNLSWWGYILVALVFTHLTICSVTIFLHRNQAHRALDLHPVVSHFCRFWLWMNTGMDTKHWTAIHRKHHAKCETPDDPHSPQVLGLATVLWQGAELYRKEALNEETIERYGQGTPDDWLERKVYHPYSGAGIRAMLVIALILFGVPGLTIWALQMAWIPFFAAGVVNGIGHYWGYRNFECADAARNIVPWGIVIGGEELHNNHHTYPTSAKFSVKAWEFDIGWLYIRILSALGLATVKRTVPKPEIIPGKSNIDAHSLRMIIVNRVQVMTQYSKDVILPLFHQVKKALPSDEKRKIKTALVREESLVADDERRSLIQFLDKHTIVKTAYHYREQLYAIWNKTTDSQQESLDAVHDWCVRAEATGIKTLQQFVEYLKGYTIQTV
jgi:stearoyl-CoA desaturase (delta-9 desaturase)